MVDDIKVSVCMTTYNHEPYIAQAVESVLAQRVSFPVELVIGEDCSTDRTREIVRNLAESHPSIIRLRLPEHNEGGKANFLSTFAMCRGQYIAMLEGDDYWTSPDKLQMQVDALDSHPDWAISFHPAQCLYEDGLNGMPVYPVDWAKPVATIDDLFRANFIPTSSVLFRNRLFPAPPSWFHRLMIGDWPLHILNAAHGNIGFIPQTMSVYRVHRSGLWSSATLATRLNEVSEMFSAVDHHFGGKYAELINRYRSAVINDVVMQLDAARNEVKNAQEQLRNAQAVADAQTQAYAESQARQSILSGYLESDLITTQNERQQLLDEVVQLQSARADLVERQRALVEKQRALMENQSSLLAKQARLLAENAQLQAFHDTWKNWMFYRVVREIRRPFRRTMRWWKQRRDAARTQATPSDSPVRKAA
jgi:glycosyltransferase involved in cell wall biosynthesis